MAWQGGDDRAGNELFERHFDSLYRFFASKCAGDAKDLIQKTLLTCVRSASRFRADAPFRAFLFGIARNELLHYWRARARKPKLDFGISSIIDLMESPRAQAAERQEQQLVREAMARIPIDLQIALELFYWEGLSSSEIAVVLGVPAGTVRSRLRRARELMEKELTALASTPALRASSSQTADQMFSRADED